MMNFQAFTLSKNPKWACIQVKAPESEVRYPIHLCCIIDISGSMEDENKLKNVKQSLYYLLDFLGPQDKISIVTFSENAKTVIHQALGSEKENIRTQLFFIQARTSTNLSAGIIQAQDTLLQDMSYKQGILLLTDGEANAGLVHTTDIINLVRGLRNNFTGTTISCIGYGIAHNTELLQNISTEGCGSYYIVNTLEDVATVFGDILGGLASAVAQQVRVILPLGTKLKCRYATNIIGYHGHEGYEECNLEVLIGDMTAGYDAIFLAKIPHASAVSLKGYNITNREYFVINSHVTENVEQTNAYAHYLRFEVLEILESPTMEKIDSCITIIMDYKVEHPHMLWDILIQQLNDKKRTIDIHDLYMRQNITCLGTMRGISQDAVFSNALQRQFSHQLSQTVNDYEVDKVDDKMDEVYEMDANQLYTCNALLIQMVNDYEVDKMDDKVDEVDEIDANQLYTHNALLI